MNRATLSSTLATFGAWADDVPAGIRVIDFEVSLPVEVLWLGSIDELVVTAPLWRWPTDFDREPGRLSVAFGVVGDER